MLIKTNMKHCFRVNREAHRVFDQTHDIFETALSLIWPHQQSITVKKCLITRST